MIDNLSRGKTDILVCLLSLSHTNKVVNAGIIANFVPLYERIHENVQNSVTNKKNLKKLNFGEWNFILHAK